VNYQSPVATRVGQLLRLALSSDRDGEVLASLSALKRTMATNGIDLHHLADAVVAGLGRPPVPAPELDWRDTARFCRSRPDLLSEKEARFIATIMSRDQPLSPKQDKWLLAIEARVRGWL
jgi:hypothetical protein